MALLIVIYAIMLSITVYDSFIIWLLFYDTHANGLWFNYYNNQAIMFITLSYKFLS
jgi:hypothetical protein